MIVARRLDLPVQIVSKWRKRFFEEGLAGLAERTRTGRRPGFPPALVVAVKAIACELPARLGLPLSRLHVPDIRSEVIRRGLVARVSDTPIWRWLSEDAKSDEFVISADEKTSIQARIRCDPTVAATASHPMLVEHEYKRGGALQYLAA